MMTQKIEKESTSRKLGDKIKHLQRMVDNINGKVGVPILLYVLGVPGFFVILIWLFFFRGK